MLKTCMAVHYSNTMLFFNSGLHIDSSSAGVSDTFKV